MDNLLEQIPSDLRHLIPGFIERREKEVRELTELVNKSDFAGIRAIGHRLKGTGMGYGFPVMSTIGAELEVAALKSDARGVRISIAELSALTQKVKESLSQKG